MSNKYKLDFYSFWSRNKSKGFSEVYTFLLVIAFSCKPNFVSYHLSLFIKLIFYDLSYSNVSFVPWLENKCAMIIFGELVKFFFHCNDPVIINQCFIYRLRFYFRQKSARHKIFE